jgi:hypothetical protein
MKKVIVLLICLFVFIFGTVFVSFAQEEKKQEIPGQNPLPGVEAAVGEWVHFKPSNFNVRIIDWAYITESPKYPAHGTATGIARRLRKSESELLQIDFEFKNPGVLARKIPLAQFELILIDKEERTFTYNGAFHDYQNFTEYPWVGKKILPGQNNKASFVCEILPNFIPAKLIIKRKIGLVNEAVIRVFMQKGERLGKIVNGIYDKGSAPKSQEIETDSTNEKADEHKHEEEHEHHH